MFNKFEDMCSYYQFCEGCPYYNCVDDDECRREFEHDKKKTMSRLDMLIEISELKNMLNKLCNHLGCK